MGFLDAETVVGVYRRTIGWGESLLFRAYNLRGEELETRLVEIWNPKENDPTSLLGDMKSPLSRVRYAHFPTPLNALDDLDIVVNCMGSEPGLFRLRLTTKPSEAGGE